MAIQQGLARAHRLHTFAVAGDTRILTWPNGRQPGYEAKGWKSFVFQPSITGTVTGSLSLTCYGTADSATAYSVNPGFPALTNARWFVMASESQQTGTGLIANPITIFDGTQTMEYDKAIECYGLLLTGTWTGGGTVNVDVFMAG